MIYEGTASVFSGESLKANYTVRFCRMQPPYDTLTTRKSFRILKHVLNPDDNRGLNSVVSMSYGGCMRQNRTVEIGLNIVRCILQL